MTEIIKISYKNWWLPARKWMRIVEKVKNGEHFADSRGFEDMMVAEDCGYCKQFKICEQCTLFLKQVDYYPICHDNFRLAKIHFSFFIMEMRREDPDFKIALYHAEVILNAILEDCPDKTQAIEDGTVCE